MPFISLNDALKSLRNGKLIVFPTETVYGMGGDVFDSEAIQKIFNIKKRPQNYPLTCLLPDVESVFRFGEAGEIAEKLGQFWPGPLTILLRHKNRIPGLITASSDLCGFRVPNHDITLELLRRFKHPIAAPSANLSGSYSPTDSATIEGVIRDNVAGVLDGGRCEYGLESTVVQIIDNQIEILRNGAITIEEFQEKGFSVRDKIKNNIEKWVEIRNKQTPIQINRNIPAPLLFLDFFPRFSDGKILQKLLESSIQFSNRKSFPKIARLTFGADFELFPGNMVLNLSKGSNLKEAARNFYLYLINLTQMKSDLIVCHKLPDRGLGRSINERMLQMAKILGKKKSDHIILIQKKI